MIKILSMRELPAKKAFLAAFSDESTLKIPMQIAAAFGLFSGMELTEDAFADLKRECSAASAKERAVRTIAACNISENALLDRLVEKGETRQDAENAVTWLKELSLLDDEKTAVQLAATAQARGYGEQRLKSMLYEKKIPKAYWQAALDRFQPNEAFLDQFLSKKFEGAAPDKKTVDKAVAALIRRGFTWSQISDALRRYQDDLTLEENTEDFS